MVVHKYLDCWLLYRQADLFWISFANLLCLRFELKLPCGLLCIGGNISRQNVNCFFRLGMNGDQIHQILVTCALQLGENCYSYLPSLGLWTPDAQLLSASVLVLLRSEWLFLVSVFLTNHPDLVPALRDLHFILNLHSRYVPQKPFKVKCAYDYCETLENEIIKKLTDVRGAMKGQVDANSSACQKLTSLLNFFFFF